MTIYKLNQENKKETIEDRLQKAINLGRRETYKEILEWLDKLTIDDADCCGHSIVSFTYFENKEQMLKSLKNHFNINLEES